MAPLVDLLCDGAPEMWNLLRAQFTAENFGEVYELIDLRHTMEKLVAAAEVIHGEGPRCDATVETAAAQQQSSRRCPPCRACRTWLRSGALSGAVRRSAFPKVPQPASRFPSVEERAKLLAAGPYWHGPTYFALKTGCRQGEI